MLIEDFKKNMDDIKSKLGDEEHGKIIGELSIFQTENDKLEKEKVDLQNALDAERKKSDQYLSANAILMQQIGSPTPPSSPQNTPSNDGDDDKKISWDECFDKNGKFID